MGQSTTQDRTQKMNPKAKQDLGQSYGQLRDYLRKLEQENKLLAADLERKRLERAKREAARTSAGQVSQERLEAMARHIAETDEAARRQREFLERMQAFFAETEQRLAAIARRLEGSEQDGDTAAGAQGTGSLNGLRDDLIGMLRELEELRRRRQELLTRA